jgi:hypothetical protein
MAEAFDQMGSYRGGLHWDLHYPELSVPLSWLPLFDVVARIV